MPYLPIGISNTRDLSVVLPPDLLLTKKEKALSSVIYELICVYFKNQNLYVNIFSPMISFIDGKHCPIYIHVSSDHSNVTIIIFG